MSNVNRLTFEDKNKKRHKTSQNWGGVGLGLGLFLTWDACVFCFDIKTDDGEQKRP